MAAGLQDIKKPIVNSPMLWATNKVQGSLLINDHNGNSNKDEPM